VPTPVAVEKRVSTASALHASSPNQRCGFCEKSHASDRCFNINKLSVPQRQEQIMSHRLCFRCLGKIHIAKICNAKCSFCNGRHHAIICLKDQSISDNTTPPSDTAVKSVSNSVGVAYSIRSDNVCTVLQTARVRVSGEKGCVEATVLFAVWSDRSYVSSKLVQKIKSNLVSTEPVSYAAFGGKPKFK
jgi:hypothetical protein